MAVQDLSGKKRSYMIRYTQAVQALLDAKLKLKGLADEWTANGYSVSIVQADINDPQLTHLTPSILANGMNEQALLESTFAGGHLTNLNAMVGG
jgi:hypothetical protein